MVLINWLCYNFLLALLPLPLVLCYLWLTNAPVSLVKIARDGQLFFYSASIAAATVGDIASHQHLKLTVAGRELCNFVLVLCIVLSCWFFGVSSGAGTINSRKLAATAYAFTLAAVLLVSSIRWGLQLF